MAGLKRIEPKSFPPVLPPGVTLQERLAERRERQERRRMERELEDAGYPPRVDPDWLDYAAVADRFDSIDHVIDLHGHIIGMGLSPDHRCVQNSLFRYNEGQQPKCVEDLVTS